MPGIALSSAAKGRLRPSFFFWFVPLVLMWLPVQAQQQVYRCGNEYTNTPSPANRCEALAPQSVTVIPGTRVQAATAAASPPPLPASSAATTRTESAPARSRDDMARTIVGAELEKARERLVQLQAEQRQAQATPSTEDPQQTQRLTQLQAAIERTGRDIESLQRELARRSSPTP